MNARKKQLLESVLTEDKTVNFKKPIGNFVVMIGGSGSGKSWVVKNLFSITNFKVLNPDNFKAFFGKKLGLDQSKPEEASQLDKIADKPSTNFIKQVIGNRKVAGDNIIFDTTGKNFEKVKSFVEAMKMVGYTTTLVYVIVDVEVAAKRNIERGQRGGHMVPDDVLRAIHLQVKNNYKRYFSLFDNIFEVLNIPGADFKSGQYIMKAK